MARRLAARGGHLLRHLERLQRGRRAQAGPPPPRAALDRHDHQRHRPALLHHRRSAARPSTSTFPSASTRSIPTPSSETRPLPEDLGGPRVTIAAREYDFVGGPAAARGQAQVGGPEARSLEEAAALREGRRSRGARRLPLLAHAPGPGAGAPAPPAATGLTLSRNLMCYEGEWLHGGRRGGQARHVAGWASGCRGASRGSCATSSRPGACALRGVEPPRPRACAIRAAAMGVPFLPTLTMLGSDLMGVGGSKTITCPYTGRRSTRCRPCFPTWRSSTCSRADRLGNCQIDGYPHMDADIARAATTVLVTAEEIVSEDEIRLQPDRTVIPGFMVDALVARAVRRLPARVLRRSTTRSPSTSRATWTGSRRAAAPRWPSTWSATSTPRRPTTTTWPSSATGAGSPRAADPRADAHRRDRGHRQRAARGDGRAASCADDTTVFTGVGAPLMASVLAQRTHAPRLTMVVEGGIIGPHVEARASCRSRPTRCAPPTARRCCPGITDAFLLAQRGFLDVGFIGGAQIDRYGNLNTSAIGGYEQPKVRLPGSGGANDIISLCREVMILTAHEKRRFVERVDFVTSPGYLAGGDSRRRQPACSSAASRAWSPRSGIFGFEAESRRMRLEAAASRASPWSRSASNTGFELGRGRARRPSPSRRATTSSRSCAALDPERQFLG